MPQAKKKTKAGDASASRALGKEESLTGRLRRISNSFYDQFQPVNDWRYWIEEIFESYLIAGDSDESTFYSVEYSVGEDEVTFTARESWQEIEKVWSPVSDDERSLLETQIEKGMLAMRSMLPSGDGQAGEPPAVSTPKERVYGYYKTNVRKSSDGKRTIFVIATDDVARDGAIIDIDGIDLSAYRDNPVVLWDHGRDPRRGREPIGVSVQLEKRTSDGQKQLLAGVEWEEDDFAQEIKRKVENGTLSMASFAWLGRPTARREVEIDGERYKVPVFEKSEMTEFSVVAIGSDRNALVVQRDIDALRDDLKRDLIQEMQGLLAQQQHIDPAELSEALDKQRSKGGAATAASAPEDSDGTATAAPSASPVPEEPPVPAQRQLGEADYARIAAHLVPRVLVGMRAELKTLVRRQLGRE